MDRWVRARLALEELSKLQDDLDWQYVKPSWQIKAKNWNNKIKHLMKMTAEGVSCSPMRARM